MLSSANEEKVMENRLRCYNHDQWKTMGLLLHGKHSKTRTTNPGQSCGRKLDNFASADDLALEWNLWKWMFIGDSKKIV